MRLHRMVVACTGQAPTMPAEQVRLRIGNLAKAVLVTGQAYQEPKDALNEFVSNAADEYAQSERRGERIQVVLRRRGRYPVIAINDVGRGMSQVLRVLTQRTVVDYLRLRRGPALARGDYEIEIVEGLGRARDPGATRRHPARGHGRRDGAHARPCAPPPPTQSNLTAPASIDARPVCATPRGWLRASARRQGGACASR